MLYSLLADSVLELFSGVRTPILARCVAPDLMGQS